MLDSIDIKKIEDADNNYTVYHLHSMLSNGVTNIDSITSYKEYIAYAQSLGMKALAFAEHGCIFEWVHKKQEIEKAGMKYIHAIEAYITNDKNIEDKHRDNYHCVLIAKNYDGVKELNKLVSTSFNRQDIHYYYTPRMTFEELYNTSDNILITTACIGGVIAKADNEQHAENRYYEDLAEVPKVRKELDVELEKMKLKPRFLSF